MALKKDGYTPVIFTALDADYPVVDHGLLEQVPADLEVHQIRIPEPRKWVKSILGDRGKQKGKPGSDLDNLFFVPRAERTTRQNIVMWIRANLFIPDARVWWRRNCVKKISKYIRQHGGDFLITSGPPHSLHLSGRQIKAQTGITWVADFRDPWTDIEYFEHLPLTTLARKKHIRLEREVLTGADGVITVSENWKLKFTRIRNKPVAVLLNGYDPADFEGLEHETQHLFRLSHIGTLQGDRLPENLFKAVKALFDKNPEWRKSFRICFAGKVDPRTKSLAELYHLGDIVEMVGILSHRQSLQFMLNSSMLLLLINRSGRNEAGRLPAKLFEYMYAQRPILMLGPVKSDAADLVRRTQTGYVCDWEDIQDIQTAIEKELRAFQSGEQSWKGVDIEAFSREKSAENLIAFLEQLKPDV